MIGYSIQWNYIRFRVTDGLEEMKEFHHDITPCDIKFGINRLDFQIQHHALNLFKMYGLFRILIDNPRYHMFHKSTVNDYNAKENLNPDQSLAVNSILASKVSEPFLLFGPPGKIFMNPFASSVFTTNW